MRVVFVALGVTDAVALGVADGVDDALALGMGSGGALMCGCGSGPLTIFGSLLQPASADAPMSAAPVDRRASQSKR